MKGARVSKILSKPKVSNRNNISTAQIVVVNSDTDLHALYWNSFLYLKWMSLELLGLTDRAITNFVK